MPKIAPTKSKVIVIVGPTASGKSDLAIKLARQFNGEIISADSRQVYRGMDIGSGKVTKREQRLAQHWLLDVANPRRTYSVARYRREARRALRDIQQRGKTAIICGGTGLYVDAILNRTAWPEVPPNPTLRAKLAQQTAAQLFAQLQKLDPQRASNIDRHNPRRLIRALEIVLTTGQPVPTLDVSQLAKTTATSNQLWLGITRPVDILNARIAKRLDQRLRQGIIAEVRRLHTQGVSWQRLDNLGLEYRWAARFLQNKITKTEMRSHLLRDIQHYAKRQLTWFKRNPQIHWLATDQSPVSTRQLVKRFLED